MTREEWAAFLCAYDDQTVDDQPDFLWAHKHVEEHFPHWMAAKHEGDCTKQCFTCVRCVADDYLKDADELMARQA